MTTWQNADENAFKQQLERNRYELSSYYPPQWNYFIEYIMMISNKIERIIDVGCGVGIYCALLQRHFPFLKYVGYDYSPVAINIALTQWGCSNFFTKDCKDLNPKDFNKKDVLLTNGLTDISIEGDEIFNIILKLNANWIIMQRVRVTSKPSYFEEYSAYNTINTVMFYHNITELYNTIKNHHYKIVKVYIDKDDNKQTLDLLLEKEK